MGFAPTWLRQASPPPASHDHFNHCLKVRKNALHLFFAKAWPPGPARCGSSPRFSSLPSRMEMVHSLIILPVDSFGVSSPRFVCPTYIFCSSARGVIVVRWRIRIEATGAVALPHFGLAMSLLIFYAMTRYVLSFTMPLVDYVVPISR